MTDADSETVPDLQAICDICLEPIADGDGSVWVDPDAADKAVRLSNATADSSQRLDEFLAANTEDVPWHTTHSTCQDIPTWAYAIAVERIRGWPAYLHWCAHLMGKTWIDGTDWQEFVLRSLEPKLAAVSGLRPLRPQSLRWGGIGG